MEWAKTSRKMMTVKCPLDVATWRLQMMVGKGHSGQWWWWKPDRSESKNWKWWRNERVYTTLYNLGSEERGQCWRGMLGQGREFLFPFNKGDSRVYLNAYGHDLVGGRVLVVWLMMFDWKKKGDASRLCCLLCVEFVLGTMLSGWHSKWLIFTVTPWSLYDYPYFTDEETGVK